MVSNSGLPVRVHWLSRRLQHKLDKVLVWSEYTRVPNQLNQLVCGVPAKICSAAEIKVFDFSSYIEVRVAKLPTRLIQQQRASNVEPVTIQTVNMWH